MQNKFDLVVIGGGPAGYVAAIRASQNGLSVCLVEKEHMGGICLNWGCIPTKALLKCADVYNTAKKASEFGVHLKIDSIDISEMVKHSRETSQKLTGGIGMLMKKHKITVKNGTAKLTSKNTVKINDSEVVEALNIIIATGASARKIDQWGVDEEIVCTYKGAMIPKTLPKNLVVIGGGVIGMEFASFYNSIGASVTVLELGKDILQTEDREIVKLARKEFEKKGIKILTDVKDIKVSNSKTTADISYEHGGKLFNEKFDKAICSIGVVPNIKNIGIEEIGIELEKNYIKTNEWMQTNIENIFAIGDVTKGPWLAHKASHEGIVATDFIAKKLGKNTHPHKINYLNIPACIYSNPQISSIGLTEERCKELGYNVKVGRFSYIGNGKALAMKDSTTFIKVIFDSRTGEILGTHMIGVDVTEMIHSISVAKQAELTEEDIMNTIFPHPTVSEMIHESVLDAYGVAIHK